MNLKVWNTYLDKKQKSREHPSLQSTQNRKAGDEENGWVHFQNLHLTYFAAPTMEVGMKKKLDQNSKVRISV